MDFSYLDESDTPGPEDCGELDALEKLCAVFEGVYDTESILEALRANSYDFDDAYEFLTAMASPVSSPSAPSSTATTSTTTPQTTSDTSQKDPRSTTVCRYWAAGHCLVKNCPYLHTQQQQQQGGGLGGSQKGGETPPPLPASAYCRYFLKGYCARGDSCAYLHRIPPVAAVAPVAAPAVVAAQTAPAVGEFPGLLRRGVGEAVEYDDEVGEGEDVWTIPERDRRLNLAQKLKLKELGEQYSSWISKEVIETIYRATRCNEAETHRVIEQECGSERPAKQPTPVSTSSPPARPPATQARGIGRAAEKAPAEMWVSTGKEVASLYERNRAEAFVHARMRNFHYRMSTEAFLRGDHAMAKEHSRKGKFHDVRMRELNDQASRQIFQSRNADYGESETGEEVLDLHGLHVNEALDVLRKRLVRSQQGQGGQRVVYVITGTGHHSYKGAAQLLPAVTGFLRQQQSFQVVDCSADGSCGMLRVTIPPSSASIRR